MVSAKTIDYPQIFNGIAVRYTCGNASLKEEIALSQAGRDNLPDPTKYGLSRNNSYLVVAMEFLLTPNNINVLARRQGNKLPIKQGNDFVFDGDEPIEFEDEHTTLHFFFPKDYAHAVGDSVTGFSNRVSLRRYFYSQAGKNYMLVGVPYNWIAGSPAGDLVIDPTTSVGASDDVWLEDNATGLGSSTQFLIGKAAGYPKKRTLIKFNTSGIPTNATVLNAQMKLYYYTANNGGSGTWVDRWVQAHQVLVSWNEAEATDDYRLTSTLWNVNYVGLNDIDAKSAYESTVLFQQDYPKWKQWDITALTQKWVNLTATNYGVVLWANNETTDGYDLRFYSSEYTTDPTMQPKLEIIYSTEATTKTVYFLKDHLGSIRATVLDSATAPVIGYDDYDPWGYSLVGRTKAIPTAYLQGASKNKFVNKLWDDDYGLNWYHLGARPYDPQIGRFPVVDRFADKYPSLTPYHYAANNPMLFIDVNGDSIQIVDEKLQQIFKNTLPAQARRYVRFDPNGVLDVNYLSENTQGIDDINLKAAILVGQAEITAFIHQSDKYQFMDEKGNITQGDLGIGIRGLTLAPDGSKFQSTVSGKIDVTININQSDLSKAQYIGHELYGHTRFYTEGRNWEHDYRAGCSAPHFLDTKLTVLTEL